MADDPQSLLQQAVALHQAGRLVEARAVYQRILMAQPRHADALHLLGVIRAQQRRLDEARWGRYPPGRRRDRPQVCAPRQRGCVVRWDRACRKGRRN